mgnify:FL=1
MKDNGDYYYYSNGKWVLVKASSTDSEAPITSETASTADSSSETSYEVPELEIPAYAPETNIDYDK